MFVFKVVDISICLIERLDADPVKDAPVEVVKEVVTEVAEESATEVSDEEVKPTTKKKTSKKKG